MSQQGYYRYATVHGDNIVFACEDDLWSVPVSGGIARRLTAGVAECSTPRFSPDGRSIAFVGREEGHPEVYLIPATGGSTQRLTYLGAETCTVSEWSPDGAEILFTCDAASPFLRHTEAFAVRPDGGMPRSLALGHVQTISISGSAAVLIGRNNNDPARWKRYRGGTAGDIWIDATATGAYRRLLSLTGNLVWPMWLGERAYFLSDHDGIGNIYSCSDDGSDLRQHTWETEYYVRFPSTDGKRIVYTAGAEVCLYDSESGNSQRIPIEAPSTATQAARRFVQAKEQLEHFSLHPAGHSLALISRGQPFTMPFWEDAAVQHGDGSRVRYRLCQWLSDGERFVVVSDKDGPEHIEVHYADQRREPLKVSDGDIGRVIELVASPVSDRLALTNHRFELIILDLESRKLRLIDRSPAERTTDLAWSPDGRWLAYSWAVHPDTRILRITEVESGTVHDVTEPLRADRAPCFDPEGQYLYFLSTRDFNPVYDALQFDLGFPQAMRPFLITLRKDITSPFSPPPRPLVKAPGGDEGSSSGELEARPATGRQKEREAVRPVEIDFEGIQGRILGFPVEEGRYEQICAVRNRALFTQFAVRGIRRGGNWWQEELEVGTLIAYDFEEQRAASLHKEVGQIGLAADCRTICYRSRDRLRVIDALEKLPEPGQERHVSDTPGRKSGWLDLGRVNVLVEPRQEWSQMYREAWRLQQEHFWDERMSQVDWDLVYNRYAKLLPRLRTRNELSDLIWEMQGELGTSHAYEMGGDLRRSPTYPRGFLGADLIFDPASAGYRIERILRGDSWDCESDSPLAEPGLAVSEGDIIVAVGGRTVSRHLPVDELLINRAGQEVMLTILSNGTARRQIVVKTLKDERALRYRFWVETNRRTVHAKSEGRLGYLHIPDMGPWGFAEFHRGYLTEFNRAGLIVDVRYNRGGHVSPLLLEKLARKRVGYDVSRWGQPLPYPPESVAGPIVGLTNQFAGSDGDIFSHCFKLYKLGPLVGKRTWGGVIGIWPRHRLVDGTVTTQPEFSFWFVDVGWRVENHGTDPDYDVDIAPHDYRSGHDPQLDKGIELAMRALLDHPVQLPAFVERPSLPLPSR